ncbi:MAG: hypothetical protein R3D66_06335 [Alphaproteobacteria bacterium]
MTKAPTAELRPGQTDQDSLPPYDLPLMKSSISPLNAMRALRASQKRS